MKIGAVAALCGLGVVGVYGYVQYRRLLKYDFAISNFYINQVTANNVSINLVVKITNPSIFTATIGAFNADISMNGIYVGTIKSTDVFKLKGHQSSDLKFDFSFPPKILLNPNLIQVFLTGTGDKSKVIVSAKGTVNIKAYSLSLNKVPFTYSDNLLDMTTTTQTV